MNSTTITLTLYLVALSSFGQTNYKGQPLIKANSAIADYRVGNDWVKGRWTISPHIEFDSLLISCHSDEEVFAFYTDRDSIVLKIMPGEINRFYVSLNDTAYALTIIKANRPNFNALRFDTLSKNNSLKFWYENNKNNEYLDSLRLKYPIDSLVRYARTDTERTSRILHWVHAQWKHDGNNEPRKSDAISILEEAKDGKNFRCVEYSIVAAACLNSIGLKARILALKTKDVETAQYGAGHVLTEVFMNDLGKWVVIDGQWDAMPVLNNVPLNAVELQKAISESYKELEIRTSSDLSKMKYVEWIHPYLYYFDTSFDNREGHIRANGIAGKTRLMLVPLGAREPKVFQSSTKIDNCSYTYSLNTFYAPPH